MSFPSFTSSAYICFYGIPLKGKPEIDQAPADQYQNHSRNKKRRDKNKKRRDKKKNEGVKKKKQLSHRKMDIRIFLFVPVS